MDAGSFNFEEAYQQHAGDLPAAQNPNGSRATDALFDPVAFEALVEEHRRNGTLVDVWKESAEKVADGYRQRGRLLSPDVLLELRRYMDRAGLPVDISLLEAAALRRTDEQARELLAAVDLDQVRGARVKRTAREFASVPQASPVIDRVLAAEVNLLVGPEGAGKSLLARDWALHVASGHAWRGYEVTEPRSVLYVASEGLHDFKDRWCTQPLWDHAADRIFVLEAVNLLASTDVDWLLSEYADERPGLIVFDVVYGMGMSDDNGMKDVLPVLNSLKRISAEWGAATLALCHPRHGEKGASPPRRARGSSQWRQLAYCDWFMGEGRLTCEKSKLTRREDLGVNYQCQYPEIIWGKPLNTLAGMSEAYDQREEELRARILTYVGENQGCSKNQVARGLGLNRNQVYATIGNLLEGCIGGLVEEDRKLWRRYTP